MFEIQLTADELTQSLLKLSEQGQVCMLDSCGVKHLGSHLLIAGIKPVESVSFSFDDPEKTLEKFDQMLAEPTLACIFTISYDFGLKLEKIRKRTKEFSTVVEPDIFCASFDCLIVHDYDSGKSFLTGNSDRFLEVASQLTKVEFDPRETKETSNVSSNFTKGEYLNKFNEIHELIRAGETYQTNLTQQFRIKLPIELSPQIIFSKLRKSHPAPFSAFIKRADDFVVSISPERFIHIDHDSAEISASPIKGTRKRGLNSADDIRLKNELENSEKDRAENVMIVDLLRNDIGRICEFGSVQVEKLCELETHPTFFHLVSTIKGKLRRDANYSEILKAVFPCGSITGAPKIRTMQIIDQLETADRGLSMGAIGYRVPPNGFELPRTFDMSVAIRTMVIRENEAIFNVGGGIVIDSDPESEYQESLLKAQAIFGVLNAELR